MQRDTPIRFATALLLCLTFWRPSPAAAQLANAPHGKPSAAQPIALQGGTISTVPPPASPQTPAQLPPHRAEVSYAQGKLAIAADNSSLNQILREIGRETGIKITGGVADERVFGKYGPSVASEVLASLLDGTGSNMLLIQSDASSPGELILTPRHGGPTPPNPNAPSFDDEPAEEPAQPPPPPQEPAPQAAPPVSAAPPNAATPGAPATPPAAGTADPNAPATDPNAVKSPQQIFEQLQRMRQQLTQ